MASGRSAPTGEPRIGRLRRLLFDEGVSTILRHDLTRHECNSVKRLGWYGTVNGTLLSRAEQAGFEALLTTDGNMAAEQNMSGRKIAVLV